MTDTALEFLVRVIHVLICVYVLDNLHTCLYVFNLHTYTYYTVLLLLEKKYFLEFLSSRMASG